MMILVIMTFTLMMTMLLRLLLMMMLVMILVMATTTTTVMIRIMILVAMMMVMMVLLMMLMKKEMDDDGLGAMRSVCRGRRHHRPLDGVEEVVHEGGAAVVQVAHQGDVARELGRLGRGGISSAFSNST